MRQPLRGIVALPILAIGLLATTLRLGLRHYASKSVPHA